MDLLSFFLSDSELLFLHCLLCRLLNWNCFSILVVWVSILFVCIFPLFHMLNSHYHHFHGWVAWFIFVNLIETGGSKEFLFFADCAKRSRWVKWFDFLLMCYSFNSCGFVLSSESWLLFGKLAKMLLIDCEKNDYDRLLVISGILSSWFLHLAIIIAFFLSCFLGI